jgi:hypothetical protein
VCWVMVVFKVARLINSGSPQEVAEKRPSRGPLSTAHYSREKTCGLVHRTGRQCCQEVARRARALLRGGVLRSCAVLGIKTVQQGSGVDRLGAQDASIWERMVPI